MIKALSESSLLFWRDAQNASHSQLLTLIGGNFILYILALYADQRVVDLTTITASVIASGFCALGGYLLVLLCIFIPYSAVNEQSGLCLARSLMLFWLISLVWFAHNAFSAVSLLNGPLAQWLPYYFPYPERPTYWLLSLAYSLLAGLIFGIWTERKESQPLRRTDTPPFVCRLAMVLFFILVNTVIFYVLVFDGTTIDLAKTLLHIKASS